MTDELFAVPESLSPRLRWMRRHGITTRRNDITETPSANWEAYQACSGDWEPGDTEHDAIANLAEALGIRLWNEEDGK
jgi:hypothetical protein